MIVLVCEDSMEGIYSSIFRAYEMHCDPKDTKAVIAGRYEPEFFADYRQIQPDRERAVRVQRTLLREFGEDNHRKISLALLSECPDKADAVYHMIAEGLKKKLGKCILEDLSDPYTMRVMELWRGTENEFLHLRGFLRFRELENGILYAAMQPKHQVLHPLMEHFCDRFPGENFIIHDTNRRSMAVHPAYGGWYYTEPPEGEWESSLQYSEEEFLYSAWFREFCRSIAIKERKNLSLQTQMLPLRFRPNMTEFKEDTKTSQ